MAEQKKALTATGVVGAGNTKFWGYTVTTALSAATVTLTETSSGVVLDVIAASTAAGTTKMLPTPIRLAGNMTATFAGTGTVLFVYD
jgi:hypothetical protein